MPTKSQQQRAHFNQQCDFIAKMLSHKTRFEMEQMRRRYWREQMRGDMEVKFVCLRRRSDGGDDVVPVEERGTVGDQRSLSLPLKERDEVVAVGEGDEMGGRKESLTSSQGAG